MPRPNPPSPGPSPDTEPRCTAKDLNMMILITVVICAFLCALGLNSMLQCMVCCASRAFTEPSEWLATWRMNTGLKKKDVVALPTSVYVESPSSSPSICAVCLVNYSEGDAIRVLPKCSHRFHVACVDRWLLGHSSCPTCRDRVKSGAKIICPIN